MTRFCQNETGFQVPCYENPLWDTVEGYVMGTAAVLTVLGGLVVGIIIACFLTCGCIHAICDLVRLIYCRLRGVETPKKMVELNFKKLRGGSAKDYQAV